MRGVQPEGGHCEYIAQPGPETSTNSDPDRELIHADVGCAIGNPCMTLPGASLWSGSGRVRYAVCDVAAAFGGSLEHLSVRPAGGFALGGARLLAGSVFELGFAPGPPGAGHCAAGAPRRGPFDRAGRQLFVGARRKPGQRQAGSSLDRADAVGNPLAGILQPVRLDVAAAVRLLEAGRLDPEAVALEQPGDAALARLRARVLAVPARRAVVGRYPTGSSYVVM